MLDRTVNGVMCEISVFRKITCIYVEATKETHNLIYDHMKMLGNKIKW